MLKGFKVELLCLGGLGGAAMFSGFKAELPCLGG